MDRFIVGTGRCGSTLLSRMLAENPSALCIFEFFNGLDMTRRFTATPAAGKSFADLISQEQPFVRMVVSRGYEVPEITYPFDAKRSRYARDDRLPYILVSALSRLSDHPDALFDEVLAFASALPEQPLAAHYRQLFGWLAQRMGRSSWIEKSGSSIDYLASLHAFFPEARFLHLHRDGPEVALSMREHAPYRLAVTLMYSLRGDRDGEPLDVAALLASDAPRADDPIGQILADRPPAEHFGRYWNDQVTRGFEAVPRIDPERYLELRFEDLVSEPREALQRVARFFELEANGDAWIERGAGLVRGVPPTRLGELAEAERARLEATCAAGRRLLGRPS